MGGLKEKSQRQKLVNMTKIFALWEEGNITTVDNVIWGCPHYLSLSNMFHVIYRATSLWNYTHTQKKHSNKQCLWTAHFATKEFQCHMRSFTTLYQPPVHDTNSRARFSPNIKSLNSNVSSGLSIITKSVHLNWIELNGVWVRALPADAPRP
jgi:glutamate racemase